MTLISESLPKYQEKFAGFNLKRWFYWCYNLKIEYSYCVNIDREVEKFKCKGLTHWPLGDAALTHWGRVTHICVSDLTSIGSDNGLSPGRRQAIIRTKCWNIVNKTLRNKLQWIFSRNSNIFIQENAFESVVCERAAILSRPQWVNLALNRMPQDLQSQMIIQHWFG